MTAEELQTGVVTLQGTHPRSAQCARRGMCVPGSVASRWCGIWEAQVRGRERGQVGAVGRDDPWRLTREGGFEDVAHEPTVAELPGARDLCQVLAQGMDCFRGGGRPGLDAMN